MVNCLEVRARNKTGLCYLAFPEQDLAGRGRDDVRAVEDTRRSLAVTAKFHVIVEHEVGKQRLQLVRREETSGAAS